MIKDFKIFEEIKRKAPEGFHIGNTFDERVAGPNNFTIQEKRLLESDDFIVNDNVAKCDDDVCNFEIRKEIPDEYSIIYELIITDKNNEKLASRKFKSDILNKTDYIDAILNICAAYRVELISKAHSDIDPYNEENWDSDNTTKKGQTVNNSESFP